MNRKMAKIDRMSAANKFHSNFKIIQPNATMEGEGR